MHGMNMKVICLLFCVGLGVNLFVRLLNKNIFSR